MRALGRLLGVPEQFIARHPFPGPGLAVRIIGDVTGELNWHWLSREKGCRILVLRAGPGVHFIDQCDLGTRYSQSGPSSQARLP